MGKISLHRLGEFLPSPFVKNPEMEKDSLRLENFREIFFKQPSFLQDKVKNVLKKHGVDVTQGTLEKKYIDIAVAALHTMYVSDLGHDVKKVPPEKVYEKIGSLLQWAPPLPELEESDEGFAKLYKIVWQDKGSRELERSVFIKILATLKTPFAYWEYLTKQVAGRDLEEGMIIPSVSGEEFYYIYKKINHSGLIAYALKPLYERSNLNPVLFFRPTQLAARAENMIETLMDNLPVEGVGYEGFHSAEKALESLMQDEGFRSPHDKITLAGYSLAGAYSQRFMAHRDNWKHVSESFLFNAPGVDVKTAKKFARKINQGTPFLSYTPALYFFRTEGDIIDQGGEMHVGSGILPSSNMKMELIRLTPHDATESFFSRHMSCYLQGGAHLEVIDLKKPENHYLLNNIKRGKGSCFWENVRKWLGFIFIPLYHLVFSLCSAWRRYFFSRDSSPN